MEQFVVSARKYRPASFDSVVGQEHITKTLQNAIEKNQLAQALLFCGPRGVGKTTCARILAHTINEFDEAQQLSQSMNIYELDAASNNSVDDIRNLIDQVRYPPQYGKFKVYIIDEVHMLSNAAFNAFLKTLEEPPAYAIFILATTEKHKVIPTILSRCQIYDFNRIGIEDMVKHLQYVAQKEGVTAEEEALHLIAQKADGALRDALSFFDMIVTFAAGKEITLEATLRNLHVLDYEYYFRITEHLVNENTADTLLVFDEILSKGFDAHNFINGLSEHLRNLMVCKDKSTVNLMEVSQSVKERYLSQASSIDLSFLLSALNLTNQCDLAYKSSKNPRLHVEICLMKLAHLRSALQLAEVGPKKKTEPHAAVEKPRDSKQQEQQQEQEQHPQQGVQPTAKPLETDESIDSVQSLETGKPIESVTPVESVEQKGGNSTMPNSDEPIATMAPPQAAVSETSTSTKTAALNRSTVKLPDLNALKDQVAPTQTVKKVESKPQTPLEEEAFTVDQLNQYWLEFAESRKAAGKSQEFLILSQTPEFIEPHTIKIKLNSAVQIDTVDNIKSDLMPFMRSKLRNHALKLEAELEIDESKPLIYTPAEKFQYLIEKHPPLRTLQEKLGLDPDF